MFTNPEIIVNKLGKRIAINYTNCFRVGFKCDADNDECLVACAIPCKLNDIEYDGEHERKFLRIDEIGSAAKFKHSYFREGRIEDIKREIIYLVKRVVSKDIECICPGICTVIGKSVEEYNSAFISSSEENKGEVKCDLNLESRLKVTS